MLNILPSGEFEYRLTKHNIIVNINGSELCLTRFAFASCITCKRFNRDTADKNICEAYPKGIPERIIKGEDRHLKSNGEDGGLYYEEE